MNESATYSEPDNLDTNELVPPQSTTPVEAILTEQEDETDKGIVTGLIEMAPFIEPGTAALNKGIGAKTSTKREPVIKVAKQCHVGAVRQRNEDSCLVFSSEAGGHYALMPFGLYILADGMGGHAKGHMASKTASRVAAHNIVSQIYLPLLQDEGGSTPIQEVMRDAVQEANTAVYHLEADSDSGTTLTVALILGRLLHVAHVGDSRIYILTNGELEAISIDHSLVQRLQDVGQLTAEEAPYYQYRHVLIRAVGQTEEVEVDTYMHRLPQNGKLLLCSDGLCGLVSDSDIQEIMTQDIPIQEIVDQLIEAALEAGGYDNITAIVVDFAL